MARRLRLLRSERPRDREAGFALVEVIVSAAVLAMVALAVLAGIDASSRSSGREKARAVAVSLAEQDQERLRGVPAKDVTSIDSPPPVTLNGATYTITSNAVYIDDATGGTDSCANSKDVASYIRITSTVTSTGFGASAPVSISSLVEPPISNVDAGEGYLAVQVNDRNGNGVPGVTAHADGPSVRDAETNAAGCAVFGPVGVGSYDITFTKTGYVDDLGRSPGKLDDVAVTQGAKTVSAVKFDLAAPLSLTFETTNPTNGSTITGSKVETVTTYDSEAPSVVTYGSASSLVSTMTLNLFPFNTPYGSIYTGACDDHDPLTVVGSNYYSTYGGVFAAKPGTPGSLTLHQPPLWLRLRKTPTSSTYASSTTSVALTATATCVDASSVAENYNMYVAPTSKAPNGEAGWLTTTSGAFDPGLPYGQYDLCAKINWGSGTVYGVLNGVVLNDPVHGFSALKEISSWPYSSKPASTCP
jgi:type II secretory pathway pseudopilin PulG